MYSRCWTCDGCGRIECSVCEAKCKLKWYIKLTVTWKTHKTDHIVERTALPDHLIRAAEGKVAFQDQQHRVRVASFEYKFVCQTWQVYHTERARVSICNYNFGFF